MTTVLNVRRTTWILAAICCSGLTFFCVPSASTIVLIAEQPASEFPAEFTHWEPYSKNPVFTAAGPGHWDEKIRERGWIIKEGDQWNLWYTGYDGTKEGRRMLGYATSNDGLIWTRFAQHPLIDEFWVEDIQIQKVGDTYYMVAEGLNDQAQLLTSKDKIHWKGLGTLDIRYTDGKPLTPGPFGTPTAYFEDGTWYLFYERSDQGIWLAKSKDLKVWNHVQDEPVIALGPDTYDSKMIALNQIVKHKGKYYAVYHGSGSTTKPSLWSTNLAVSSDLIHWKKYPGNPLRPASENKSSGLLVNDGEQFRLYTMHDKVQVHFPTKK
ncbi:MAG: Beta-xylosidase [Planctomycetaceae bacterium]|nr:Beta-xylosidase [Planctomycetaceae bacterium]